jgi:hypothetical protein|eukprot:COSAG03_NODE_693_length_6256_cov_6.381355_2_plen_149_part_00
MIVNASYMHLTQGRVGWSRCVPPACKWTGPWGGTFITALSITAALYVAGGALYAHKVQGKEISPATALTAHPHYERWVALSGMIMDGVTFSRARVEEWRTGEKAAYKPVPEAQPAADSDDKLSKSAKAEAAEEAANDGQAEEEEDLVE